MHSPKSPKMMLDFRYEIVGIFLFLEICHRDFPFDLGVHIN